MPGFTLYIHVPFCSREKCPYCDFYSVSSPTPEQVESYLRALDVELTRSLEDYPEDLQVESIYFGGGTPSLLEPEHLWRIYCRIKSLWSLIPDVEFTLECNPEDLSLRRATSYLSTGVNRLSVGCQSFDDRQLELLGRTHRESDCRAAVENAREAGFVRLSVDLIFGAPQSDEQSLLESINKTLSLGANHLSIYGYHLEENCPAYNRADLAPVEDELYRSQYLTACSKLKDAGWRHYEISNWAASNAEFCRHNLAYWSRRPSLGCGPAAHSFRPPEFRIWNPDDLEEYIKTGERKIPLSRRTERLDKEQVLLEEIMLGLRQEPGVESALIEEFTGDRLEETLLALQEEGLGSLTEGGRLALSERGWLVYDEILRRLVGSR
jgi:oxygen-independent coproporphyrinogen-3 oxidase